MSWGSTAPYPSYWVGARPRETHRLSTSATELGHIGIALVVLTVDFILLQLRTISGLGGPALAGVAPGIDWGAVIGYALAAALTGFLLHELAHKVAAQRRGLWAEFRASPMGLLFSFVIAFGFGFLFAAPGATVVDGVGDLEDWGVISIAGPIVNILGGGLFLAVFWALPVGALPAGLYVALGFLAFINGWFATFNLIPFGPLDGRKVLRWSRSVWIAGIAISGALAGLAYYGLFVAPLPR